MAALKQFFTDLQCSQDPDTVWTPDRIARAEACFAAAEPRTALLDAIVAACWLDPELLNDAEEIVDWLGYAARQLESARIAATRQVRHAAIRQSGVDGP